MVVRDRFEVGCACSGVLEHMGNLGDAVQMVGQLWDKTHNGEGHTLTAFDRMARRGQIELWTFKPGMQHPDPTRRRS